MYALDQFCSIGIFKKWKFGIRICRNLFYSLMKLNWKKMLFFSVYDVSIWYMTKAILVRNKSGNQFAALKILKQEEVHILHIMLILIKSFTYHFYISFYISWRRQQTFTGKVLLVSIILKIIYEDNSILFSLSTFIVISCILWINKI